MALPGVLTLDGVIRRYPWGSRRAIQALLGIEPDGRPAAELWFGAHPDAPSTVVSQGATLDALIAADPSAVLGDAVVAEFGPQLPFLLKVLAAATPLSLQVHPTSAQAQAGFAAEDARGVPRDAAERNYRDRNHKPELLCALTPFEALCGFRPVADTLRLLAELDVPELASVADLLAVENGLRAAFTALLTQPDPAPLVDAVVVAARRIGPDSEWAGPASAVAHTVEEFPGDIGVVLSLLLNHVRLAPGEAIYLGAGNVHAYLRGVGVEIMANSDNVLRCGLTAKHVDVAELLRVTDFTPLSQPRWPDSGHGGFGVDFEAPVRDFHLHTVDLDAYRKPGREAGSCATGNAWQPYLVLCTSGWVEVDVEGTVVRLDPGQAAFVPAREATFTLRGLGQTFLATVG